MACEWPEVQLGDLVHIKHGYAFKGEYFCEESRPNALATPGNFAIGGGFLEAKTKFYDGPVPAEFVLAPGDLIVTMTDLSKTSDTLGYAAVVPRSLAYRLLHNQRIGLVRLERPDAVTVEFLHWLMRSPPYRHEILASASGSTVRHTSPSRIGAYRFRLPPPDEQRRITAILSPLDDKIELNRKMNQTLEALAQALFKSWFIDFHGHDDLVDSEIGPVPRGSRVGAVADIAQVIDCLHSRKPDRCTDGPQLLQLWNLRDDGLVDTAAPYPISEEDFSLWTSRILPAAGDCVITNVGRVGAVSQIPPGLRCALGRNMTAVRPKPEFPFHTYLVEALRSSAMRAEIDAKTDSGTIMNALNVRNIGRLRLYLPQESELAAFERVGRPMRARMEMLLAESTTLTTLRDTLLPKLISGELRVPDAEAAVSEAL